MRSSRWWRCASIRELSLTNIASRTASTDVRAARCAGCRCVALLPRQPPPGVTPHGRPWIRRSRSGGRAVEPWRRRSQRRGRGTAARTAGAPSRSGTVSAPRGRWLAISARSCAASRPRGTASRSIPQHLPTHGDGRARQGDGCDAPRVLQPPGSLAANLRVPGGSSSVCSRCYRTAGATDTPASKAAAARRRSQVARTTSTPRSARSSAVARCTASAPRNP